MKKTLTINLGGSVFHIDEDAYQLLDKYLNNLRIHFRKEEGSEEILNDFEMRISELFNERIRLGYQVITIEEVENIIQRMGKPEELFDEDAKEEKESTEAAPQEAPKAQRKRLMRDPDNKIIGGVAGGFAAYMGWDATAIRILLFLLIFFTHGFVVPFYLLCWMVMPLARTATEKLEMRGESVTIENIGKTVTDGFEKVGHSANEFIQSDKPASAFHKIADGFVQVIGFILKFIAILAGIILFPILGLVLFVLLIVAFALLVGGTGVLYHFSPFGMDWYSGAPTALVFMGCISFIIFLGIPVFYIGYAICRSFFHVKPLTATAKWILIVLWVLSIILSGVYFYQTGINGWNSLPWNWDNTYYYSF